LSCDASPMRLPIALPAPVGGLVRLATPPPLLQKTLVAYAVRALWLHLRRRVTSRCRPNDAQRRAAMEEARRLAPAPEPRLIGGERIDSLTYCRFLSVCDWDAKRAAKLLRRDFRWRIKYKPKTLHNTDMPNMNRQRAWVVLLRPVGRAGALFGGGSGSSYSQFYSGGSRSRKRSGGSALWDLRREPLHPPHTRPPFTQWRYTRQGMPITVCIVNNWYPERCSHDERIRHVAYHIEHYIRRMPVRAGGTRRVQRACFMVDLHNFRPAMLPYIKASIDILRSHYPSRLGVACFFNVPGYFHPVWKIISPWLDEEIISKTFFLPRSVSTIDQAVHWVDRKRLPDPADTWVA